MTSPVQYAYKQVQATTPATLALPGNATGGNTIVVAISVYSADGLNATLPTPTDANGTYSSGLNGGLNTINCGIALFYVPNCTGGVTHSTSVKSNAASPDGNCYMSVALYEFPGLTTSPFDKSNTANTVNGGAGQTSQATGTTGTLTQASEFAIVLMGFDDNPGVGNEGIVVPSGYTVDPNIPSSFQDTSDYIGLQVGWKDVSATTALNPSFTWASQANITSTYAGIATFKKAASGGGTATIWLLTH